MSDIPARDWLTIAAIIIGPILAVQAQRLLEALRDRRNRRLAIFHGLMATRAARVSPQHVQALNMIDIEFYGRRLFGTRMQTPAEKAVTNAWRIYSDHLNNRYPDADIARWIEDGDKLLAQLLFDMSRALGYDFDQVELRRSYYSPIAHGKRELQDNAIREGLERWLSNKQPLAVTVYSPPVSLSEGQIPPTTGGGATA